MRSLRLPACVLLAAVLLAPSARAASDRCTAPQHARVVKASSSAVVYARGAKAGEEGSTEYWACLRSRGRLIGLGSVQRIDISGIRETLSRLRLSGRFVAYVRDARDHRYMSGSLSVAVIDLRSERWRSARLDLGSHPEIPITATHLVLTARGSAAWLQRAPWGEQVLALDRAGRRRTLDTGPAGAIAGLRLPDGAIARWTNAGVARHAAL